MATPVLPEIITTQHDTNYVLANIMNIPFDCCQDNGALIWILQTKKGEHQGSTECWRGNTLKIF